LTLPKKYGPWAIVTGASRGIGRAFCEALAAQGTNLVLFARNRVLLEQLSEELRRKHGVETRVVVGDLARPRELLALLEHETKGLDIGLLIANAAIAHFGQLHKIREEDITGLIDVNVTSLALLAHYFGKRLVARGGGGIMLVSSNGAYCMLPNQANYAASKAYVAHLGEILYFELKNRNVDVTTLFPPLVDTDMADDVSGTGGWHFDKMPMGFGVRAQAADVARDALAALGRSQRVHPPKASAVFMWIIRRLPDRLRFSIFNHIFSKAVDPENSWL
jgi:uncharacterized protein